MKRRGRPLDHCTQTERETFQETKSPREYVKLFTFKVLSFPPCVTV